MSQGDRPAAARTVGRSEEINCDTTNTTCERTFSSPKLIKYFGSVFVLLAAMMFAADCVAEHKKSMSCSMARAQYSSAASIVLAHDSLHRAPFASPIAARK